MPGQFVTVRFHGVSKPNAILLPQRAVQQGPKGTVVYVVGEGSKVAIRDVKATVWRGDDWLIEDGLRAGEQIMVDGFQRVMPGAEVKPVQAAAHSAAPAAASPPSSEGTSRPSPDGTPPASSEGRPAAAASPEGTR